jgi:hypothetical protein
MRRPRSFHEAKLRQFGGNIPQWPLMPLRRSAAQPSRFPHQGRIDLSPALAPGLNAAQLGCRQPCLDQLRLPGRPFDAMEAPVAFPAQRYEVLLVVGAAVNARRQVMVIEVAAVTAGDAEVQTQSFPQ